MPFEWMMAFRYLRPKRTYVSAITLISILGVTLGVGVMIVVIAVMTGFDHDLREKLVSFNAHIRIERPDKPLRNWEEIIQRVRSRPHVVGAAPYVLGQVMVKTQPLHGNPKYFVPVIRGIDPRYEPGVSKVLNSIVAGKADLKGYSVILGEDLARALGVWVGDALAIYSVHQFEDWDRARETGIQEVPLPDDYVVRGIFRVGFYEFDSMFLLCSLANAQDLYGLNNSVHGVMVRLDDPNRAPEVQQDLEHILGPGYRITTWMEENSTILQALVVEKHMMFYLLFFITIVAAFGICSALITFVVQKTREIGTLKALGATQFQIMKIFLSQSLIVGLIGVVAGLGLGLLAVAYRNDVLDFLRRATGFELFPASVYNFSELPALVIPRDVLTIVGASLLICLLAGVIPAWNAGRLQPVEALRHE